MMYADETLSLACSVFIVIWLQGMYWLTHHTHWRWLTLAWLAVSSPVTIMRSDSERGPSLQNGTRRSLCWIVFSSWRVMCKGKLLVIFKMWTCSRNVGASRLVLFMPLAFLSCGDDPGCVYFTTCMPCAMVWIVSSLHWSCPFSLSSYSASSTSSCPSPSHAFSNLWTLCPYISRCCPSDVLYLSTCVVYLKYF